MTSISSPSNFHNRIDPQNLPVQENSADPTPIPKPDLSWWRRLLNFFKELFDRLFNRNQESQLNNGNKGNNGNNDGDTVIFTAQTVSGQEPLGWKPAPPNQPPVARHGRHGGGGSATPQQAVVHPMNHKDDDQKPKSHGDASVARPGGHGGDYHAISPQASTQNHASKDTQQHGPTHDKRHKAKGSAATKTQAKRRPYSAKSPLLSDRKLNFDLIHQVGRLSEEQQPNEGVQHHVKALHKMLKDQINIFLQQIAKNPPLTLQDDIKDALHTIEEGDRASCTVSTSNSVDDNAVEIRVSPPSIETLLCDTIQSSSDDQLKQLAKDMLTTLQITKQATTLAHGNNLLEQINSKIHTLPPEHIQYLDHLQQKLRNSTEHNQNFNIEYSNIVRITASALENNKAQQLQDTTLIPFTQSLLAQIRNALADKLKSHTDVPTTKDAIQQNDMTMLSGFNKLFSPETVEPMIKQHMYNDFTELLTLRFKTPMDQLPPQNRISPILDSINRDADIATDYLKKINDKLQTIPEEYNNFVQSLLEFMKTFLPARTGISKDDVEKWIASPEFSQGIKWWVPQELTAARPYF